MPEVTNPRRDAQEVLPGGYEARVLEPSPPANLDPSWYADDPTDPGEVPAESLVTPIPEEGTPWSAMADADDRVASFAHDHWLDGRRRLQALPGGYDEGRRALHQIAFFAVAPKRHAVNRKLGLRYTHRGFGTPFFRQDGRDAQVRVEGTLVVVQAGAAVEAESITSVGETARFLGLDYSSEWFDGFHDPLQPVDPDAGLRPDEDVASAIGAWFGFATHVLERARRTTGARDVSRVQLWPEHFDAAFEMGSAEHGNRAGYGASPGDEEHPRPYLYVGAWGEVDRTDDFWNAPSFNGARLDYDTLLASEDPYATAVGFYREAHTRLTD